MDTVNVTEQKILEAAKTVFYKKGLGGTRMQEIADEAGINRALLNYYFRTKQKLYRRVLMDTMEEMTPEFEAKVLDTLTLRQFIEVMVNFFIDLNLTNPTFHVFYIITLNENPDLILSFLDQRAANGDPMDSLIKKIEEAIEREEIRSLLPEHLIWNIVSLCSYPFLVESVIKRYQDKSDLEMKAFFIQRKQEIVELVWNGIKR